MAFQEVTVLPPPAQQSEEEFLRISTEMRNVAVATGDATGVLASSEITASSFNKPAGQRRALQPCDPPILESIFRLIPGTGVSIRVNISLFDFICKTCTLSKYLFDTYF